MLSFEDSRPPAPTKQLLDRVEDSHEVDIPHRNQNISFSTDSFDISIDDLEEVGVKQIEVCILRQPLPGFVKRISPLIQIYLNSLQMGRGKIALRCPGK